MKKKNKRKNYRSEEPCIVCGEIEQVCYHHLRSVGSGGSDKPENLIPVCARHHVEVHSMGLSIFSRTHKPVKQWLIKHGWEYDYFSNKWRND